MRRAPSRPVQAILIFVLWLAVTVLTGRPPTDQQTIASLVTEGIARQLVLASAFLLATILALRWRGLGFAPPRRGTIRLLWLPGLYLLFFSVLVVAVGLPPPGLAAIILANTLLVGFSEEVMFRGVLYSGLRDRLAIWPAALVTTLTFGVVHMMNTLVTGHLLAAALQSLAACLSGLLFLALRLRMASIWPVILLHAAWDFGLVALARDAVPLAPDESIPLAMQAGSILFVLPLGLYGAWLMRRIVRDGDGLGPGQPSGPSGPAPATSAPWSPPAR